MPQIPTINESISLTKKIGNFVSNIFLGETKEVIIQTAVKVDAMEKDVDEIKTNFLKLTDKVGGHGLDIHGLKIFTRYGFSLSPTAPNNLGLELLEKSQFSMQYPKLKQKIFDLMDAMNLRTLYDYEQGAIAALEQLKSDPDVDPIKDYLVNNPGDTFEVIFRIASWIIRDEYNAHKNPGSPVGTSEKY